MKLGTEKIEAIVKNLKDVIILTKVIREDGKVDLNDLPAVVAFLPKLPSLIEDFKAIGEAYAEIKDIDVAEVVHLIQKINEAVKEVEQA